MESGKSHGTAYFRGGDPRGRGGTLLDDLTDTILDHRIGRGDQGVAVLHQDTIDRIGFDRAIRHGGGEGRVIEEDAVTRVRVDDIVLDDVAQAEAVQVDAVGPVA